MSDDKLEWQKNVKPIYNKKIYSDVNNLQHSFLAHYSSHFQKNQEVINNRLDLHGCTLDQAYHKFIDFIIKNYQIGNKYLLIITGHSNTTHNTETIKSSLYKWLHDIKVEHMILSYQQSSKKHGGKGAFCIILRRQKIRESNR